ncbi:MAG: CYTH domain-containing protein [Spongiibacter sp.]|uniref:CYTH domain-containing protein n=1 Tax=Spongiibacter thalassae TaxID=2721624 RepID=A0ABX1GEI6_9GAMM|nr:CYTH domain-containing protein [Spongiibacter thalassae]MDX1504824.1 CYTH domain-containing protein [Spongiibacter sp.]NKI17571.1 CYTH domain-containing protein [Spongiibacter thalassae]
MADEIERKFLVTGDGWRQGQPQRLVQGYLNRDPERCVRVRIADDSGFLTVKGKTIGIRRAEFEYSIPLADAEHLLTLCDGPIIDKQRYRIPAGELCWEVDEFTGANAGLVVAEIELSSEHQSFLRPEWLGTEVSNDARYYNSNLSKHPFSEWQAEQD